MKTPGRCRGLYAISDALLIPDERLVLAVGQAILGGARPMRDAPIGVSYYDRMDLAGVATRADRRHRRRHAG